ncbi:restriction endonuclease [Alphaproteobacteria bacterium]|nr:restriction endonuclease [Alphaproteobacteria bacterium]
MTVPPFEAFMYPTLKNSLEVVHVSDLADICAKELSLNQEDLDEKTGGQTQLKYKDRTTWSVTYLTQAKLLERVKKAHYKITQRGQELLNSGITTLNQKILTDYEEFRDFKSRTSTYRKSKDKEENLTAGDKIENAVKEIEVVVKAEILDRIFQQNPYFFETLVVDLLKSMGYAGADNFASTTKKSGDGGIDGILFQDALGLDTVYVQAKRYAVENIINEREMRDFIGALDVKGSTKGIFITTSDFNNKALETIKLSSKKVVTVNGERLCELMLEYSVGIKNEKIHKIPRVDEDYFTE